MAQLDRESAERHKIEALLRELLDARRNRPSLPRVRRIRITTPSQTQAQRLHRRTMVAGGPLAKPSQARASCMI